MIGYYVHHHGAGHLHRALAIARSADCEVTGLSTAPAPSGWPGDWVQLADDAVPEPTGRFDASGRLHYVPARHPGLRARMAQISAWIDSAGPSAMVIDVSVEVAVLARLHGIPVVTVAQPGLRTDDAHSLGYAISEIILGPWPTAATESMWVANAAAIPKLRAVGAISRFPVAGSRTAPVPGHVVVLNGAGGAGPELALWAQAQNATRDWHWTFLGREAGTWVDDPFEIVASASVVVSHCGQNAISEIAAARRPAVFLPQARPFDEQCYTACTLAAMSALPTTVLDSWPAAAAWSSILANASMQDGEAWSTWNDGLGAARAAELLEEFESGLELSADRSA